MRRRLADQRAVEIQASHLAAVWAGLHMPRATTPKYLAIGSTPKRLPNSISGANLETTTGMKDHALPGPSVFFIDPSGFIPSVPIRISLFA